MYAMIQATPVGNEEVRHETMADTPKQEIKLFYCYAREDKSLRDELEKHLSWLKRRYQLKNWHDREILPGEEWEQAIDTHLNSAHLILLLVSPDFMASDYCYGIEMKRALERHKAGTCRVVPILLRPTFWEEAPFSSLQLLPTDARPITRWPDRDEAFQNVVSEISRTIKDLLISLKFKADAMTRTGRTLEDPPVPLKTRNEWNAEGLTHFRFKRYDEALAAFEQALRLDPNNAIAYSNKGAALNNLKRYNEALAAAEQALRLDPNNAIAYNNKGPTHNNLKRYDEALAAYEQALRLDPNNAIAYNNKGDTLNNLKRYDEALAAFEQALRLDPN